MWFRDWFNDTYLRLYEHRNVADAESQVSALVELLSLRRLQEGVLCDLGCGAGRHLGVLRRIGAQAFGLDLSETLLRRASPECSSCLVRGDIRSLPFPSGKFSGLTSFFTSFGYFETLAEHEATLCEWRRVLAPGGFLFLDLPNAVRVENELVAAESFKREGLAVSITRSLSRDPERVEKKILVEREDGGQEEYEERVMLFSEETIVSLLKGAGFHRWKLFGDLSWGAFGPHSERMYVLAEV